jgi:hypothetical protein
MWDEENIEEKKYNPYAVDWRFLPERALIVKDYVRHSIVSTSNTAARTKTLSALWLATMGRKTINAIKTAGFLFIHIPKTSGTSISACLYGRNLPHYTAEFYFDVFGQSVSMFPSFSIIRNPVERVVSAYKMAIFGGTDIVAYDRYARSKLRGLASLDHYVDFIFARRSSLSFLPKELREQVSFIEDREGRVLVDRLFPLGNSRGLPLELGQWLGIHHIPHLNATKEYEIDVSSDTRGKIVEIYHRDFRIYNELVQNLSEVGEEMILGDKSAKLNRELQMPPISRLTANADMTSRTSEGHTVWPRVADN